MNAESLDYVDMEEESEDPIPTDECLLELQRPIVRPPLKSTRERSPTPERFDSIVREGTFVKADYTGLIIKLEMKDILKAILFSF